jgi:hypothetical protein
LSKQYVDVKPFEGGQTPTWMLGYIMKDNSEAWWNMGILGYSEADCRAGLNLHCTYHNGRFEDGKTLLTKKDFLHAAYSFYSTNLTPLSLSIVQIVRFMILSGRFLPAMSWIIPSGDKPLGLPRTQIHFKWAQEAFAATIEEIPLYFWGDGTGVELTRNTNQHRSEAGLYQHEGASPNCVVVDNAHWTEATGWTRNNKYDSMGYAQAKEEALRHRDGLDTQNDRDQALIDGGCGYYCDTIVTVPTIVATNGNYLLGQDNNPANLQTADIVAENADGIVNYRNYLATENSVEEPWNYCEDRTGARVDVGSMGAGGDSMHEDNDVGHAMGLANYAAWEEREDGEYEEWDDVPGGNVINITNDTENRLSNAMQIQAAHSHAVTNPAVERVAQTDTAGTSRTVRENTRRRVGKRQRSRFIEDQAQASDENDSLDDEDDDDQDPALGGFIIPDHESELGSESEHSATDDSGVADSITTRSGGETRPARRDYGVMDGQRLFIIYYSVILFTSCPSS